MDLDHTDFLQKRQKTTIVNTVIKEERQITQISNIMPKSNNNPSSDSLFVTGSRQYGDVHVGGRRAALTTPRIVPCDIMKVQNTSNCLFKARAMFTKLISDPRLHNTYKLTTSSNRRGNVQRFFVQAIFIMFRPVYIA